MRAARATCVVKVRAVMHAQTAVCLHQEGGGAGARPEPRTKGLFFYPFFSRFCFPPPFPLYIFSHMIGASYIRVGAGGLREDCSASACPSCKKR